MRTAAEQLLANLIEECSATGSCIDSKALADAQAHMERVRDVEDAIREGKPTLTLFVAHVDRQYGGPEEGGWYYDTGAPVSRNDVDAERIGAALFGPHVFVAIRKGEHWMVPPMLRDVQKQMQAVCDAINTDDRRHNPNSVLSRGDWLETKWQRNEPGQDTAPRAWPKERPHYE